MKKLILIFVLLLCGALSAQQVVVQNDITSNTEWVSSNEYILDGLIFVDSLATLTIQPGTVIKGLKQSNITTGDGASALIIRRGAKLMAEGTALSPIIFTSEDDDITNPNDLTAIDRGLWGGLIVLGSATTNQPTTNNQVEGIDNDPALYGGFNDDDNSGVLRFISIRHGGFSISGVSGDEINGLTMGAVGRGTKIEYIEVFANFDDGYEWFGGTVNTRYLVAAFCGDDAFDYDQGFRGNGQFWFTIQGPDESGRGGEHDGGDDDETGTPYAIPNIANATYIGAGSSATPGGDGNDRTLYFRDNAGGRYTNSIFTEYAGVAVAIEDLASGEDTRSRLEAGDLRLANNYWFDYGAGSDLLTLASGDQWAADSLAANGNQLVDPQLRGTSRNNNDGLDPRPLLSSPAVGGATQLADPYFIDVAYHGAFDPNANLWTEGWTALDSYGYTGDLPGGSANEVVVTNDITTDTEWTANNEYVLNGLVFVDSLSTLTIQAGTVVKGRKQANITSGDGASALIIRRGGKLYAEGTAVSPIIFTSEDDDVTDPNDLTAIDRGLWGGLILLGSATTNQPTTNNQVEGIDNDPALYGGTNDADNSGTLRYISIRHGGFSISGVSGDEINGLTMGAVGSGTTIEYIEVFANFDDGYEWFGGTVNTKYLVAAFCGDDAYDYDQGFRGKGQYWFTLQGPDESGRGGEHDGGDDDETGTPYAIPQISNATYIGAGSGATPGGDGNDRALYFRDNAGGKYHSSIFTEYVGVAVAIEDLASGEDSRSRLEAGDLLLANNYWWNFGGGSTLLDLASGDQWAADSLADNGNQLADPQLANVTWNNNGTLDMRPSASGPAASGAVVPSDPFYDQVSFAGAFDPNKGLWTEGWTALSAYGYTVTTITGIEDRRIDNANVPVGFAVKQNYPNPFNPVTHIEYSIHRPTNVSLVVYNVRGQEVATLVNGRRAVGEYMVTWDAAHLATGVYFYRFQAGNTVETKRMLLVK